MTKTMRILTLLLLTMVGAGQMWAETDEPSNIKRGTITGGSIAFYADEACTSDFEGDVAANATVYVKATPETGNTAIGVTFTAKKGISSDAMQAPRRSAESPGIAADITVSAVSRHWQAWHLQFYDAQRREYKRHHYRLVRCRFDGAGELCR